MRKYIDIVLLGLVIVWLLATLNLVYDNYELQRGKLRVEAKLRTCMFKLEEEKNSTAYLLAQIKNLITSKE